MIKELFPAIGFIIGLFCLVGIIGCIVRNKRSDK